MADYDTTKWAPVGDAPTVDTTKWKVIAPPMSGLAGPTELRKGVGPIEHGAEELTRLGSFGVGAALGGPAGGGVGGSAADLGIALLHHFLHGTPINITPQTLQSDMTDNMVGSYAGEGAGQVLAPVAKGMGRALLDKSGIDAAAKEASDATVKENLTGQTKLQGAAAKEAFGQKEAAAKAAATTGASNLKARGDVAGATTAAQTSMDATQKAAEEKAQAATSALANQEAQKVLPEAKVSAIQDAAGGAGPTSLEQGPERIERNEQFRESVKAPLIKWRSEWGAKRNDLLAPYMDTPADPAPLRDSVAQQAAQWQNAGRAPFSPRVQKLIAKVTDVGQPPTDEELLQQAGYSSEDVQGILSPARGDAISPKKLDPTAPEPSPSIAARRAAAEGDRPNSVVTGLRQRWEQANPGVGQTSVRELLAQQAEANSIAQASKGADRTMAQSVSRGIDESLSGIAPTPELKALNAEYRDHRENFPMAFEDKVSNAARPVDAAPEIFNHPQRAMDLIKLGTPETKQQLGQLYADYVTENGAKVIDKSHAPFLGKLFPNTPYANPDAWIFADKAEQHLAQVIDSSPAVKAKWEAAMAEGQQKIKSDYATSLVKDAYRDAKTLGPMGDRLAAQMRAAKTPEQAADIASKFYKSMTPEQAASEMGATQQKPGQAAFQSAITAPRDARSALQNFQPKSPDDAAIKAIQGGYTPTNRWKSMARRAEIWGMIAIGMEATMGRTSGYAATGLGAAGLVGARELLVKGFRNSLKDPATATAYYKAMLNPGAPGSFATIAGEAAKAGMSDLTAQGVKAETGTDLEGKPEEKPKTGAGVKSLETSRAEAIAPTPSATKRAGEVIADLGKGKTPDVHNDLTRGRLSMDEANKLVTHAGKTNTTAMLDHVPLTESVDALEVASPDERKMLTPLVEQKMRQELQGGKYNRTMMASLAQRLQRLKAEA